MSGVPDEHLKDTKVKTDKTGSKVWFKPDANVFDTVNFNFETVSKRLKELAFLNKGLEIIEAKWLFGVDIADIRAVIHRESIIHSMVEFTDNSILAQLSLPSMKHPIQYAFTYPARTETPDKALDLTQIGTLSFFEPDEETFSALALAKQAGKDGGIMPVVLNAANEVAVDAFLSQKIKFLQIADTVGEILVRTPRQGTPSLEEIFAADRETRRKTEEYLARGTQRPGSMC